MNVQREEFITYLKTNDLLDNAKPVTGHNISVMQYIKDDKLVAYAKYDKTDGRCLVSYVICTIH
jgi:hypothetical protein